jgi:hypothetical protein
MNAASSLIHSIALSAAAIVGVSFHRFVNGRVYLPMVETCVGNALQFHIPDGKHIATAPWLQKIAMHHHKIVAVVCGWAPRCYWRGNVALIKTPLHKCSAPSVTFAKIYAAQILFYFLAIILAGGFSHTDLRGVNLLYTSLPQTISSAKKYNQ